MARMLAADEVALWIAEGHAMNARPSPGEHRLTEAEAEAWRAKGRRQREEEECQIRYALTHDSTGKEV